MTDKIKPCRICGKKPIVDDMIEIERFFITCEWTDDHPNISVSVQADNSEEATKDWNKIN